MTEVAPLITTAEVTDAALRSLAGDGDPAYEGRLQEKLAWVERCRGLAPGTLGSVWWESGGFPRPSVESGREVFRVDYLPGEGFRSKQDRPPVALIGTFGDQEPPTPGPMHNEPPVAEGHGIDVVWSMVVEVGVVGAGRADVIRRAAWRGWAVAACLLQHSPRLDGVKVPLALLDSDPASGTDVGTADTVAVARFLFAVRVRGAVPLTPEFRTRPDDPYAAPQLPDVWTPSHEVIKEPIR